MNREELNSKPLGYVLVLENGKHVIKHRQYRFVSTPTHTGPVFRTRWTDDMGLLDTAGSRDYTSKQLEHAKIVNGYQSQYSGIPY